MRKEEGNHAFRLLVLIIVFFGNAYRIDVARIVLLPHITTLCAAGTVQKIEIHTATVTILQSILSPVVQQRHDERSCRLRGQLYLPLLSFLTSPLLARINSQNRNPTELL